MDQGNERNNGSMKQWINDRKNNGSMNERNNGSMRQWIKQWIKETKKIMDQ